MTNLPQYCLLSANMERIFPSEQGRPGGGADLLTVGLLQPQALPRQSLQGAGRHVRVVPGDVVPAEVVSQDEDYVGLPSSLAAYQLGQTAESQTETLHRSETTILTGK